tara:strand:- start:199 stop:615 length:417 start_codon:yes stop_codon:yes gene_type:complete
MKKNILGDKSLIIFDGVCVMCNRLIIYLIKKDKNDLFKFISLQSKEINNYTDIHKNQLKKSITVINNTKIYSKSDAILFIAKNLNLKIAFIIGVIPKPIRNLLYKIIAHLRYKLFGKTKHCMILKSTLNKKQLNKIIL